MAWTTDARSSTRTLAAMTEDEKGHPSRPLKLDGQSVEAVGFADFLAADDRRATSFVSNFGEWALPGEAAEALASPVGRLEWFHDTDELVLIGGDPEPGTTDTEIEPAGSPSGGITAVVGAVADTLAGPLGAPGIIYRSADGAVRETVLGEVLSAQARVAVLAIVHHGPKVHELLWGWHLHHRQPDGWTWLLGRLSTLE